MRRMLLLAVTAALLVAGSAGPAAGARDEPKLIVHEGCQYLFDGRYGGWFDVVGLEPNTEYRFEYVGTGAHYFTTDASGVGVSVGGGEHTEPFELTIQISLNGSVVLEEHVAFTRPCMTDPTTKEQCKHGGWRDFGFESRRDCIRFVKSQARQTCRAERDAIGHEAFREKYGRCKRHGRAIHNCVKQTISTG